MFFGFAKNLFILYLLSLIRLLSMFFTPIPGGLTGLLGLACVFGTLICLFIKQTFYFLSNSLFIFCRNSGNLSESMLFFKSWLIFSTAWRIESVTAPSGRSRPLSELTTFIKVWNINRNVCTSCSLILKSSFMSLILSRRTFFSSLILFLSSISSLHRSISLLAVVAACFIVKILIISTKLLPLL